MSIALVAVLVAATITAATPILLASLGGLLTQQANILNIGLEGMILVGAFVAVTVSAATGSALIGVTAAAIAGIALASCLAWVSLRLKADFIVAGIAINLVASGVTVFLMQTLFEAAGNYSPPNMPELARINLGPLADLPVLSWILQGQTVLVVAALALVPIIHFVLMRTTFGLHLRAVGEAEEAASANGLPVYQIKFLSVTISGVLCGLAGAQLAMATLDSFIREMSAGRGFIAVAVVLIARAWPWPALLAALLFGAADAIGNRLQLEGLPSQFVLMMPYAAAIIAVTVAAIALSRKRGFAVSPDHATQP